MDPHFAAGVQQDAHEFLRSLTANMHLADLSVGGSPHPHTQKHTNMLDGIFGGLLRSQVRCGFCFTDSVRYDTFLDLSLEVHRSVFFDEALRSFADIDVLEGDSKYDCTVCTTKTCATKRLTLHSTPRVLQLHLHCVALCFSVLQERKALGHRASVGDVRCSVLQCAVVYCSVLQCVAVCCSVLLCVAVCCSVLQFVAGV